jgi:branched-chain amino acid transport system ATP-binding protein
MSENVLMRVERISKSFFGLSVLRHVTLDIAQGTITGLIGPNGAGKSTLFNIVSGFLTPDDGDVIYKGKSIARSSVTNRGRLGIMRTFQSPQIFGHMTVRENLVVGCHKLSRSGFLSNVLGLHSSRRELAKMNMIAAEALSRFDLEGVADARAGDLTAGEQRLLELARGTLAAPNLLCLDEPSSGLNADESRQLRLTLEQLNRDGATIFLVSHDMELMEAASTVNVLCFGEIIAQGDFGSVKVNPVVREAYLGV